MTTLTARSPEDLLAVVPVVLGFEPADSIVMLTVRADQTFHARVDLPSEEDVGEVVDLLLEPAVRHRARAVVLLLYTCEDTLARAVVSRMRRAGGRVPVPELVEALRVDGGRWFPLLRDRRGAGRTGVPYDVSTHPFVVEAVVEGRVLQGSRADLAATLRPDPAGVAEVEAARDGTRGSAAWVADAVAEWAARADPAPAAVAARVLESLAAPDARDASWAGVRRATARDHVRLWEGLVRRSPEDLVAHAAAVLALCAWVAGDGALAWCAVDRAREGGARPTLADLVSDLLLGAVAPVEWDTLCHRLAS